MSIIPYSGSKYTPVFVFPDRVNIPREFDIQYYDDNELLEFKADDLGRLAIIELSKAPYIRYEYFNWDYKGQDSTYKWYYLSPSGGISYRLFPSGTLLPLLPDNSDAFWTDYSAYIDKPNAGKGVGYFKEETFARTDMIDNPTGWIINDDPFPVAGSVAKPDYSGLLSNQYKPITLNVGTTRTSSDDVIVGDDVTKYKENKTPILDKNAVENIKSLQYYFDGRNIVTNYSFFDKTLQDSVHVEYEYTIDKLKLVAKLHTNKKGQSEYTPVIDNYVLKISTQRVNK